MINNINSYSNHINNVDNLNSNKNNQINNLNDNIVNNNTLNQIQNKNSNLVNDKSQAVDKILGYGVDKDGFFTSDFNEAAGLPKDYKIYADGLNNFVNNFIKRQPFYSQIDIAKTIGNAYNSFSSFVKDKGLGESFQEQDLKNLSQKDGVNYWQELQSGNAFIWKLADENIADLGSNKYQIHDNKISKGGALIAFFINNLSTIKGQTTLLGKLAGLNSDTDNNEIKEFLSFMNKNGNYVPSKSGLCGIGVANCSAPSQNKLQEYMQVAGDPVLNALGYTVKRQVKVSNLGQPYVLFTYGVIVYNYSSQTAYRINSSAVLNNNIIIKELAGRYKEQMESALSILEGKI